MLPAEATVLCRRIVDEIDRAVVGRGSVVDHVLVAVLASGHVLLEDLPGLGKTQLARCLATVLGCRCTRVQFTPDLLPGDLTGSSLFDPRTQEFVFRPGPIFTHVLLADEINRTPPKTQAALLEAMQEGQVSVDGVTTRLEPPFIVLATQNPLEFDGTYPLPEAQLDRFAVRLSLGYLSTAQETALLHARVSRRVPEVELNAVVDVATVLELRAALEEVYVHDDVVDYVIRLIQASREHPQVLVGASPRAALTLLQLARGRAVVAGRDFVTGDDVKTEAEPALAHRLTLKPELWVRRITGGDLIQEILATVPVPAVERSRPPAHPTSSRPRPSSTAAQTQTQAQAQSRAAR